MAGDFDIPEANWSLVAIVAIIIGAVGYGIYYLINNSPASAALGNIGDLASSITAAPSTILGANNTPVAVNNPNVGSISTPGDSSLFYTGIKNFFSTGSIYGNQGN